jgi:hypothetical protein
MKFVLSLLTVTLLASLASAQYAPRSYGLAGNGRLDVAAPEPRLVSNVIIDIVATNVPDTLWIGTGDGLARVRFLDRDTTIDSLGFESYREAQGVGKGGASGILWTDSIIWASFAFDTSVGISGAGGGLAYSRDQGVTWTRLPQPRDRHRGNYRADGFDLVLGYWPTTTNVDNITYDIAQSDSFVWIASKGGGLRRHAYAADYTDYNNDTTGWLVVDTLVLEPAGDTLLFHPGEEPAGRIHRPFSVIYAEGAVWAGTAAGILKSTNNGRTWQQFTPQNSGITGSFITALGYQEATHTVWAATWSTDNAAEYYAVSKTSDGGATWIASLTPAQIEQALGHSDIARAHSFAFDSTVVYVCDDLGLWKSIDGGATWDLFDVADPAHGVQNLQTGTRFFESQTYAALADSAHRLWVGGVDGLGVSGDNGGKWDVAQSHVDLAAPAHVVDTYAAPTPWSPQRFRPVWLWYSTTGGDVKVTIYDFAMSKVVELPTVNRGPGERYETWDGRKNGTLVANGTYFYKISKPGGDVWGKLIVLD